jgi:hypothetical protein
MEPPYEISHAIPYPEGKLRHWKIQLKFWTIEALFCIFPRPAGWSRIFFVWEDGWRRHPLSY